MSIYAGTLDRVAEWKPDREQFCDNKAAWLPVFDLPDEKGGDGGGEWRRCVRNPGTARPERVL